MSEISTSLTIHFSAAELDEPFELVVNDDDQGGSAPVQVAFSRLTSGVCGWGRICYSMSQITPLEVIEPGKKRVKLYCSKRVAATARLIISGGEARLIGRRSETVVETITWSKEHTKQLRWLYDHPVLEIIEQTSFRNKQGDLVTPPRYDRQRGAFHASQEVIGALVVRYTVGFSLYEIIYGNGEESVSAAQFVEMQNAWQSGNVESAEIPPVRIIALSDWHATQASFPRKFWPSGAPSVSLRQASPSGSSDKDEPAEEEEPSSEGFYQEVPGTRQTVLEKIYHPDDPEQFIEVKKTLYLEARDTVTGKALKIRFLNHAASTTSA
ncbi:hypothetical protein Mmc1_1275 [Magnetococcus marinus MC-1]|uniref:Uncharacterized protein n=1 Tax=Magnetococcus marinus (strain ATCC BAA-1437 / JCM 17883 / MC-1) TaxID=156889 RepID=A0L743_MAGMM|nr:hypothetical protein [Magnetococcus marinus]ABK43786.1 hypothetical protein Mmc1_1275 [Magnetococcus marinus MC-1]